MLRVKFGIWHQGPAILFPDQIPGKFGVDLLIPQSPMAMRSIVIRPGDTQMRLFPNVGDEEYPWELRDPTAKAEGFARCALMVLSLNETKHGWWAELPPNHALPWPLVKECDAYNKAEELFRECIIRKESARIHGVPVPPPPGYVTKKLTRRMRVELFS